MPHRSFGNDYLNYVAAPLSDPGQGIQPWFTFIEPSLQWDIPSLFDPSTIPIDNISYDFSTYGSTTSLHHTEPTVVLSEGISPYLPAYSHQQTGPWNVPTQQLWLADEAVYNQDLYEPSAVAPTASASEPIPGTPANPSYRSHSSSSSDDENNESMWSAPFVEQGKSKRRCTLCDAVVKNDYGTRKRHEYSLRHQKLLPKSKRAEIPLLKCSICGHTFKSKRRCSLKRHMRDCKRKK